jgi:hypothetical protein
VSAESNPIDQERIFYRLRARGENQPSSAVCVRVTPGADLYLAIGAGKRRMHLTVNEAWALWRCLSEAVATTGEPPDWIRVNVPATTT